MGREKALDSSIRSNFVDHGTISRYGCVGEKKPAPPTTKGKFSKGKFSVPAIKAPPSFNSWRQRHPLNLPTFNQPPSQPAHRLKGTLQMKFTYDTEKPITHSDIEHFASIVEPEFFELFVRAYTQEQLSILLRKPEINQYSVFCTYEHNKDGAKWRAWGMESKSKVLRTAEGDFLATCVEQVALFLRLESSNKLTLLDPAGDGTPSDECFI